MSLRTPSLLRQSLLACTALVAFAFITGCAMNSSVPSDTVLPQISGVVHGGQSPIQGAAVILYVTSNAATGYGQPGTLIGSGTTDVNGSFTISPSATTVTCPSGQQAYITSSGGFPSGSPALANTSVLMMAALGDCVNISSSTTVVINEVTTVAAAYALSGFTTTLPVGNVPAQAFVSAPAANRAASGSLTAASGLAHAFQNAATLASYSLGTANALTANIKVAGTTVNGSVPAVEINTLGDILQSCVNGATGNASCVSLFADTPSISGAAPTNTLQSMINLARNPYPSAAAMNSASSTSLFGLINGSPAFQPQLGTEPPDWSLAIVYKATALFPSDYDISLDANDTIYTGRAATNANVVGLSAYGLTTPTFTAAASGTATRQIAADALGNVWMTNNGALLTQYSASTGSILNTYTFTGGDIYGVAVDKANNVWVANAVTTTPNITEFAYSAGTYTANYTATAPGGFEPVELTIDASQNVWASDYFTGGTLAVVLPNLTPLSTPSYTASGTTISPISATFAGSAIKPLGVVIDASGNAWYGITGSNTVTTTGIEEVIPTLATSVITGLTPQTFINGATLGAQASQIPGIDGAGSIYIPDNFGSGALGIHVYSTTSVSSSNTASQVLSPPSGYLGCYLATASTTTCGSGTASAVYNPREVAIDSTGSVWADQSTTGGLTQVIGLAAPTWPLLQTGKPGLSPGSSTVTPLP